MNDVFLKAYHGGLGDALQFSTLPEEFYKQEGRKTYIVEDAPFRNQEIYDLVWGKNPYVLGKKEGEWNAGDTPDIPYQQLCMDGKGTDNMISNWELYHGLKPINKHPKIYYEPEIHDGFKDVFIVDYNSTSIVYDKNQLKNILDDMKKEYSDKRFLCVNYKILDCECEDILPGEHRVSPRLCFPSLRCFSLETLSVEELVAAVLPCGAEWRWRREGRGRSWGGD